MKTVRKTEIASWRYSVFKYFLIFISLIITLRLFQIQILNHSRYLAEAKRQQFKQTLIHSKRGGIFDRNKSPLAQSIMGYSVYVDNKRNEISADQVSELSQLLNIKRDDLVSTLQAKSTRLLLAPNINQYQKDRLGQLKITGLSWESVYQRYYTEDDMLCHVLGFIGKDRHGIETGYYGVEQYYDGDLAGTPGEILQEKSASGKIILWGNADKIPPLEGSDLVLTVDRNVQFLVERLLESGVEKYAAESGSVIVIEPKTGEIIAMANYPSYHPNEYTKYFDDKDILRNASISEIYEPGSVMKAITMASALDSGKVKVDSTYNDYGPKTFSGHIVDNWDKKHHGIETMTSILQHSNNLGAAWVGLQIGDKLLMRYFNQFGFGRKLGIDLDGEESGLLYQTDNLKDIELVNASFGQGISLTPLQVTSAFSAIANDGLLMKPHIVKEVLSQDKSIAIKPEVFSRPISKNTSDIMVKMLTEAVSGGEAKFFVTKKYLVAGKTGTAQVPIPGGYDADRTNATFVGFFPTYKNFVMLVWIREPKSPSGYAAETAVPLWMNIAEELASYYSLPPDKE